MKAPELPPRELPVSFATFREATAEDILADLTYLLRVQRISGHAPDSTIAGRHARERRRVKRARAKARRRVR